MDSYEFWTSISAIIRNGFDGEGLKKLEEPKIRKQSQWQSQLQ